MSRQITPPPTPAAAPASAPPSAPASALTTSTSTKRRHSTISTDSPNPIATSSNHPNITDFPSTNSHSNINNNSPNTTALTTSTKPRVVLLHFNALLDSHATITHVIHKLFATATLPLPSDTAILAAFATTPFLHEILTRLGLPLQPSEAAPYEQAYAAIYRREAMTKLTMAADTASALEKFARGGVAVGVLSKQGFGVTKWMVETLGLEGKVGLILPEGGAAGGGEMDRQFVEAWETLGKPWVNGGRVDGEGEMDVLVVSRTVYDLEVASKIGARICWLRGFEMEEKVLVGGVEPDLVVRGLDELAAKAFEGGQGEEHKDQNVVVLDGDESNGSDDDLDN